MRHLSGTLLALVISTANAETQATTEVICSYAPSQSATVNRISSLVSGAGAGTELTMFFTGVSPVLHSSGATIFTGSAGYIAGTMPGAIAATTMVTAGLLVAGAVVTFELACAPKNHPEMVASVLDGARSYKASTQSKWVDLFQKGREYKIVLEDKFYELIGETWYERMLRKAKSGLGIS
jgi:hypothetical protein